ncbi:hypothetical protein HanPSC8_Chr17g0781641 [Helianthus annuus]|nr:hypothetical protein HanPSC8_Chr17g0781641 [Helianthus annuus]
MVYDHFSCQHCNFLITVVRVIKLRLIWQPSRSLAPSALVCDALSLPAKSTKFCTSVG